MAKLNNKGFFLAETIVVVGIVVTVLVLFYSQISALYNNYERNAKYNTVESVHAAHNIQIYISQNSSFSTLVSALSAAGTPLFDITNYSFDTTNQYSALLNDLNISKVYFTPYNINDVISNYASYNINAGFLDFLRTLKVKDTKNNTYRIIVVLNNNTYTSMLVNA